MDRIEDYANRPKRYSNIDGLAELSIGLIIAAFPLCWWLSTIIPKGYGLGVVLFLFPILLVVWAPRGAEAVRKRITYRRTGFVQQRRDPVLLQFLLVAGLLVFMVYAAVVVPPLRDLTASALVGIYGVLLAAGYGYEFARVVRWKWIVALALLCGFLAVPVLLRKSSDWGWLGWVGPLFAFAGVTWIVSGSVSFYFYLKHTQAAARTAE